MEAQTIERIETRAAFYAAGTASERDKAIREHYAPSYRAELRKLASLGVAGPALEDEGEEDA